MFNAADLDPVRTRTGCTLHEKELACRTVWITLHYHRTIREVRQKRWSNVEVILNQISFRDSEFRPEQFVEIGELHDPSTELDFKIRLPFRQLDSVLRFAKLKRLQLTASDSN